MRRTAAVLGIFILSGAAGLVYEIAWARQLVLAFANTTQAVSAILTGFFGGTRRVERTTPRRCRRNHSAPDVSSRG